MQRRSPRLRFVLGLIDRLTVRSRDDDRKAFLAKRLGQPQSLASRILARVSQGSVLSRPCRYPAPHRRGTRIHPRNKSRRLAFLPVLNAWIGIAFPCFNCSRVTLVSALQRLLQGQSQLRQKRGGSRLLPAAPWSAPSYVLWNLCRRPTVQRRGRCRLEVHRVHAGGDGLGAFLHDRLGENRGGRGAVSSKVGELRSHLAAASGEPRAPAAAHLFALTQIKTPAFVAA